MPAKGTRLIHFLNSKNKYELQELDIADRTGTILEVKKVLTKTNLMMKLEDKFQTMQLARDRFNRKATKGESKRWQGIRKITLL